MELQNDNVFLRNKITENERTQQQMNILPSTSEYDILTPFDSRNFLQVLQPAQHYSQQQQQAGLQLGYGQLVMNTN
ncbi:hypothetical protein GW17_00041625 [Ensete ventricosum]|nr:hypothetical protein GW17_00041625 [Ensete ventricosum]